MTAALIVYSTTDGHTAKICERIADVMRSSVERVTVMDVRTARDLELAFDIATFDIVVVGASVRYGRHADAICEFIARHRAALEACSTAFFSVNLTARKPAKRDPDTNPYVRKFLERAAWHPRRLAVFAGKLDYPRSRFLDRLMIRLIMKVTDGPTDPRTVVDYTDWVAVDVFARELATVAARPRRPQPSSSGSCGK